jgi:hypothetical protein
MAIIGKIGNGLKKMSQRALWRGDRSQSEMISQHGVFGMRQNMLNDTPSYKKTAIGNTSSSQKISLTNNKNITKGNTSVSSKKNTNQGKTSGIGKGILDNFM